MQKPDNDKPIKPTARKKAAAAGGAAALLAALPSILPAREPQKALMPPQTAPAADTDDGRPAELTSPLAEPITSEMREPVITVAGDPGIAAPKNTSHADAILSKTDCEIRIPVSELKNFFNTNSNFIGYACFLPDSLYYNARNGSISKEKDSTHCQQIVGNHECLANSITLNLLPDDGDAFLNAVLAGKSIPIGHSDPAAQENIAKALSIFCTVYQTVDSVDRISKLSPGSVYLCFKNNLEENILEILFKIRNALNVVPGDRNTLLYGYMDSHSIPFHEKLQEFQRDPTLDSRGYGRSTIVRLAKDIEHIFQAPQGASPSLFTWIGNGKAPEFKLGDDSILLDISKDPLSMPFLGQTSEAISAIMGTLNDISKNKQPVHAK